MTEETKVEETVEETAEKVAGETAEDDSSNEKPVRGLIHKNGNYLIVNPMDVDIDENWNPRKDYGDMEEFKKSIRSRGVITPLLVSIEDDEDGDPRVVVRHGHRRTLACRELIASGCNYKKVNEIHAILEDPAKSEEDMYIDTCFVANDAKALTPLEEAYAFQRMIDEFGMNKTAIARKTGKSNATITQRMKVLKAPEDVLDRLAVGQITFTDVLEIVDKGEDAEKASEEAAEKAKMREDDKAERDKNKEENGSNTDTEGSSGGGGGEEKEESEPPKKKPKLKKAMEIRSMLKVERLALYSLAYDPESQEMTEDELNDVKREKIGYIQALLDVLGLDDQDVLPDEFIEEQQKKDVEEGSEGSKESTEEPALESNDI